MLRRGNMKGIDTMATKNYKIYKQALKDYDGVCELFNGKDFEECIKTCETNKLDSFNEDEELFDINFGVCCFTINNEDGKGKVCSESIDIWDDKQCCVIAECVTIEQIEEMAQK